MLRVTANFIKQFAFWSYLIAVILLLCRFLKVLGLRKLIYRPFREVAERTGAHPAGLCAENVTGADGTPHENSAGVSIFRIVPARVSNLLFSLKELFTRESNREFKIYLSIVFFALLSRLIIYLLGYMTVMLVNNQDVGFFPSFQQIWDKWDSLHYVSIAKDGYVNYGDARNLIVFFPLYPVVIKLFSVLFHDYFLAGVIASNIGLIIACIYIYKLAKREYDERTAQRSVRYMLIYPFSFFFGIAYAESLFVAITIMFFYYLREKKWFLAAVLGMLAALTRNQGSLLVIPAFFEIIDDMDIIDSVRNKELLRRLSEVVKKGLPMLLIPAGTFIYFFLNWRVTGHWFEFLRIQDEHWHHKFGYFVQSIENNFMNISAYGSSMKVSLWMPQILSFIVAIILCYYALEKMRISYVAYMLAYIQVSFAPTFLLSGSRYIAGLFPLFILIALLSRNRVFNTLATVISSVLLCFYTIAFTLGGGVM